MRILVISNMYPSEASPVFGAFVQRQVEALRRAGVEVMLATNANRSSGPMANLAKYGTLTLRARGMASQGAELVHAHYLLPTAIIGDLASWRRDLPLVLTAHGDDIDNSANSRLSGRIGIALGRASAVLCVSRYLAGRLREHFDVDPSRIHVLDCGVETSRFKPMPQDDARVLADLPAGTKVVLFAGHLSDSKGLGTLLAAHRRIVAEGEEVVLAVAGDGPLAGELEAARERSKGMIRVLGEVSHEKMPALFSAADLACVPSHREGFGLVALESLACGTPVVASDVGGLPEIVRHGATGQLVPPADPDALADALLQMLENPPQSFEEAARRTAREHSLDCTVSKLIGIYGSVLEVA